MSDEPLDTNSQRCYLLAEFFILAENCPSDLGDPSACPFHEIRERSREEKIAWFEKLSPEAIANIHTYCQLCWNKHKI